MNINIKQISKNLILFVIISLLILLSYVIFIGGPKRAYEREDRLFIEAMMKKEGYNEARLLSRFSLDDVYYITNVKTEDGHKIVWFNKDLSKVEENDVYEIDRAYEAAKKLGVSKEKISYGVYEDTLVYVLKGNKFETYLDVDTLDVVFHLGSDF
ncbi:transporter [Erysipelothrix urinaevulpis]|uniref:transporter n=1 Tax=Erysipelothrix urinaevulpis TaxID=2683717 RepID=UPI001359584E|nr:transporter [Erysipelothrix urinaevulpis]